MRLGLLGKELSYSKSPIIHQAIFDAMDLEATYDLIEVEPKDMDAEKFKEIMSSYDGINVTIPYKTLIMPYLDEIDEDAKAIGAVNTVVKRKGKTIGYNTDYFGVMQSIASLSQSDFEGAIVLGTGGASKAVLQYLKKLALTEILWVSRRPSADLSEDGISLVDYEKLEALRPEKYLLVNCTPVGMATYEAKLPVSEEIIKGQKGVFDLIYNPVVTPLLDCSEKYAIPNLNGLKMLIVQAIYAEKLWYNEIDLDENLLIPIIRARLEKA